MLFVELLISGNSMGKRICEGMPSEVHTKKHTKLTSLVGESYQNRDNLIDNI